MVLGRFGGGKSTLSSKVDTMTMGSMAMAMAGGVEVEGWVHA